MAKEVNVNNQTQLTIYLSERSEHLDEIMWLDTVYKKSDITGSIFCVRKEY